MDEFSRREWCRFAAEQGGIGSCVARTTCSSSENGEHLVFQQGQKIIVLCCVSQPDDGPRPEGWFLGYANNEIGYFDGAYMESVPPLLCVGSVERPLPPHSDVFADTPVPLQSLIVPPDRKLVAFDPNVGVPMNMCSTQDLPSPRPRSPTLRDDALFSSSTEHLDKPVNEMVPEAGEILAPPEKASSLAAEPTLPQQQQPSETNDNAFEYEDVYSIYNTYFRPSMSLMPSDMPIMESPPRIVRASGLSDGDDTTDTLSEGNGTVTQARPVDKVMDSVPDNVTNRLLLHKDDSATLLDSSTHSSTDSSVPATSPPPQSHTLPLTKSDTAPLTPSKTSGVRSVATSTNGSPHRGVAEMHQSHATSSPQRSVKTYGSTPQSSPRRMAPSAPSASPPPSMNGSRVSLSTMRESPLARPVPNIYGSPRSKPYLDMSEHALPEKAQLFQQWTKLLTDRSTSSRVRRKAQQLTHVGVPSALRGRVWLLLAEKHLRLKRGVFDQMCRTSAESQQHPEKYQFSELIEQDLNQCFPLSQPFEGLGGSTRDTIRSILHAYAFFNPTVGYTEGMCLLVGLLLTHLHAEDAFWLLDAVVHSYGMEHIYAGDMRRLHVDNLVVDELVRMTEPALHERFREMHIEPIMFLPGWILPVFVRTLPWATLLRVWDMFMCYGYTFLLRTTVAILGLSKQRLMQMPTIQGRTMVLRNLVFVDPAPLTEERVLKQAMELPVTDKDIMRMEASAEQLVQGGGGPSTTLDQGGRDGVIRGSVQGKPVTKKTLRVLMGRKT